MTAKELKKLLESVPDDTLIVSPGHDHNYREVRAWLDTALYDEDCDILSEDHGEEITPEAECGTRINVLVVS